jgi:hypothetical protein
MLIPLLTSLVLTYAFPPGRAVQYDMSVRFQGYVQVFGGKDADIELQMIVEATGQEPDGEGRLQASSEIKSVAMRVNGADMPIEPKNITRFFPRTTISYTPEGKVLKTDAPETKLPVKLPALDPKRFPDISYLPVEFPTGGIEQGKTFEFSKAFGDSQVVFKVTPVAIAEATVNLELRMTQEYSQFEDRFGNPVEAKPAIKVVTRVTGEGVGAFDRRRGIMAKLQVVANAASVATDLGSGKTSERKLKTTLSVTALDDK